MTGPEFRTIRESLGLTQEEMAWRLGYHGRGQSTRSMISGWEHGRRPIPIRVALLAAEIAKAKK